VNAGRQLCARLTSPFRGRLTAAADDNLPQMRAAAAKCRHFARACGKVEGFGLRRVNSGSDFRRAQ